MCFRGGLEKVSFESMNQAKKIKGETTIDYVQIICE